MNGYIEEMMNGQKVVKVFCHEEESQEAFNKLNDALCESAYKANNYANFLGPINAQLGNISYVLCAIVGGVLALGNVGRIHAGRSGEFPDVQQELQHANQPDQYADECNRNGTCRSGAYLPSAG